MRPLHRFLILNAILFSAVAHEASARRCSVELESVFDDGQLLTDGFGAAAFEDFLRPLRDPVTQQASLLRTRVRQDGKPERSIHLLPVTDGDGIVGFELEENGHGVKHLKDEFTNKRRIQMTPPRKLAKFIPEIEILSLTSPDFRSDTGGVIVLRYARNAASHPEFSLTLSKKGDQWTLSANGADGRPVEVTSMEIEAGDKGIRKITLVGPNGSVAIAG